MADIRVQVIPKPGTAGNLAARSITEDLGARVDELGDSVMEVARGLQRRLTRDSASALRLRFVE
jgi:hypothetical protein